MNSSFQKVAATIQLLTTEAVSLDEVIIGDSGRLLKLELTKEGGWLTQQPSSTKRPKIISRVSAIEQIPPILDLDEAFVGREEELRQCIAALKDSHVVEIQGVRGIGKTLFVRYLIHHFAYNLSVKFPAGIVYKQLHSEQNLEDLLHFIFKSFYRSSCYYKPGISTIEDCLKNKQALIVLDQFHLSRHDVAKLRAVMPQCTLLLITQKPTGFGQATSILLNGLSVEDAVNLAVQRLGRTLSPIEQKAVQSLCDKLQGNPLEILQQLANVQNSTETLLALDRSLQLATSAASRVKHLLRSISTPESRILKALAVFGGAALSLQQIGLIADVADAKLYVDSLRQKHLVQFENARTSTGKSLLQLLEGSRYSISPNLIEHFQREDLTAYRQRSFLYFINRLQTQRYSESWAESDTIVELLHWGMNSDADLDILLLKNLDRFLLLSGQWGVRKQFLQRYVHLTDRLEQKAEQAFALQELGVQELCLGNLPNAVQLLNQSLEVHPSALAQRHLEYAVSSAPPAATFSVPSATEGQPTSNPPGSKLPFYLMFKKLPSPPAWSYLAVPLVLAAVFVGSGFRTLSMYRASNASPVLPASEPASPQLDTAPLASEPASPGLVSNPKSASTDALIASLPPLNGDLGSVPSSFADPNSPVVPLAVPVVSEAVLQNLTRTIAPPPVPSSPIQANNPAVPVDRPSEPISPSVAEAPVAEASIQTAPPVAPLSPSDSPESEQRLDTRLDTVEQPRPEADEVQLAQAQRPASESESQPASAAQGNTLSQSMCSALRNQWQESSDAGSGSATMKRIIQAGNCSQWGITVP